jgi:hypothetical protein
MRSNECWTTADTSDFCWSKSLSTSIPPAVSTEALSTITQFLERVVAMQNNKKGQILYFGARKSDKLVRCYPKPGLGYRVELECHSNLLRRNRIRTLDDFVCLPEMIQPKHLQFVDIDWNKLKRHLSKHLGGRADAVLAKARSRATSARRVARYLRKEGISNPHRLLVSLAINKEVSRAFNRWERHF